MLADPRAASLVDNFGGQWLYLRNMALVAPDPYAFADFDANLREAMAREMELFLDRQIRRDHGVLELLTSDETFVNQRLAEHYGIPGVYGNHFRPVALDGGLSPRRGLLGKGSPADGDLLRAPHVAGRPRQVAAREHPRLAAPAARPRTCPPWPRTTTAVSRPARCASASRCTARTPRARAATGSWTPWASRSRTSTPSAAGGR